MWVDSREEGGSLIKGSTPGDILALRASIDRLRLRWDRDQTAWYSPLTKARLVNELEADGVELESPTEQGLFTAIVKGKGARSRAERKDRPPRGFTAIPKSKSGGYRRKKGNKYEYWYPDGAGKRTTAAKADRKAEMKKLGQVVGQKRQAAKGFADQLVEKISKASTDLGAWYAKNHHKVDELVEAMHVAETWAHLHGIHVKHVLTHAMHFALSEDHDDVDLIKSEQE